MRTEAREPHTALQGCAPGGPLRGPNTCSTLPVVARGNLTKQLRPSSSVKRQPGFTTVQGKGGKSGKGLCERSHLGTPQNGTSRAGPMSESLLTPSLETTKSCPNWTPYLPFPATRWAFPRAQPHAMSPVDSTAARSAPLAASGHLGSVMATWE